MSKFYIKNGKNEFLPIELNSIINEDFQDKLVIVKVGNDVCQVSKKDLLETVKSFEEADVINKIKNVSFIITPYQIEIGVEDKTSIDDRCVYLQIKDCDIHFLEDEVKELYRRIKQKHKNVIVLPSPLKIKDYQYVKDVLKRCQIKKEKRKVR
jgi:hypothetical protein